MDVGVLCSDHVQLRLSGGGSPCTGRVEIYYNRTWGSVCADSWDLADADVVCKQLGCGKALDMSLTASCGPDSGPVWLDELNCSGNESFLWECPSASWDNHDCSHEEDVRIMCSEHKELRLVNGKHRCEGRVEVFYNGTWGTVCSDTFDGPDADVICKQLQCGPLSSIDYYTQSFGEGSGPIWLDGMECISHESLLWQCQTEPWGKHNCEHREDAGVVCSEAKVIKEQPHRSKDCIREHDCKRTRDNGYACLEVKCTGSESSLADCPSSSLAQSDCDHKEDASVICSGLDVPPVAVSSTSAEQGYTTTFILVAVCFGVPLICVLISLMMVIQKKSIRRGFVTSSNGSLAGLYQAIYEEIGNIPPGKDSYQIRGAVADSIESLNQIEYYTSHSLGDTDPGSENPEGNSSSIQVHSSQTRTDPGLPVPSIADNYEDVHCDTFTAADVPPTMGSDCVVQHLTSPLVR
ncbi:antigen WC1.1-like [Heterodontus francisci]|uniref:antigen WC1.1-like n=1 Tax=Heterodontus francisci TaxID=7792 RepID=UPI00355ADC71